MYSPLFRKYGLISCHCMLPKGALIPGTLVSKLIESGISPMNYILIKLVDLSKGLIINEFKKKTYSAVLMS